MSGFRGKIEAHAQAMKSMCTEMNGESKDTCLEHFRLFWKENFKPN